MAQLIQIDLMQSWQCNCGVNFLAVNKLSYEKGAKIPYHNCPNTQNVWAKRPICQHDFGITWYQLKTRQIHIAIPNNQLLDTNLASKLRLNNGGSLTPLWTEGHTTHTHKGQLHSSCHSRHVTHTTHGHNWQLHSSRACNHISQLVALSHRCKPDRKEDEPIFCLLSPIYTKYWRHKCVWTRLIMVHLKPTDQEFPLVGKVLVRLDSFDQFYTFAVSGIFFYNLLFYPRVRFIINEGSYYKPKAL